MFAHAGEVGLFLANDALRPATITTIYCCGIIQDTCYFTDSDSITLWRLHVPKKTHLSPHQTTIKTTERVVVMFKPDRRGR